MASPSTWRSSWKTRTTISDSVIPSSCYCITTPSFLSFPLRNRTRNKTHFSKFTINISCSSSSSSSSASSSSSSSAAVNSEILLPSIAVKFVKKEAVLMERSPEEEDGSLSLPMEEATQQLKPKSFSSMELVKNESSSSPTQTQQGSGISFNSLFGKRPLWKRILFASTKVRSIIFLNVITIVYASNIPVLKEVEAIIDPAAFTVVRFTLSAIPFLPFVFRARGDVQTRSAGIELGIWVSLGYLMQALGLITSDAGRASFISLFTIIVVPLLDGMLGATVPAHTWFGAIMSIVGVTMLEYSGSPPCVGDLFNFLSAVFFGVHMLRTEHISRSTKTDNVFALLGYEVCVIALFSTLWYFLGGWISGTQWNPASWTWTMVGDWLISFPWIPALYTGVFSTILCLWVEMAAMRDVSATETAIIYGLEPLWGAGFAWVLLGERWGTTGWIGAALVLGGSLTVQICGSSSDVSLEDKDSIMESNSLLVVDKQNSLSTLPVVVSPRKDVSNVQKE